MMWNNTVSLGKKGNAFLPVEFEQSKTISPFMQKI